MPHFALRYLSNNQEVTSSLYSESYHNVAVIFASIPDYLDFYTEAEVHKKGIITKLNEYNTFKAILLQNMHLWAYTIFYIFLGVACLEILNDIIVSFDKLLFNKEFARIEKIKVSFYFKISISKLIEFQR